MENITAVGIDLSKNVMHLHGINHTGRGILRKKVLRARFLEELVKLPAGTKLFMEACSGAHYWCNQIEKLGYQARQIDGRAVRRYVKSQKNDFRDAEAIAEASTREHINFVTTKSVEQLELQAIQRVRERLIKNRTALSNEIRGFLTELGIVLPKSISQLAHYLQRRAYLEDERVTATFSAIISELSEELNELNTRVSRIESSLNERAKAMPVVKRLQSVPGIGPITAISLVAAFGNAAQFKNGRHLAAACGLVPRQHSTGGKTSLGSITKRGNSHIRCLVIHGARNLVRYATAKKKCDKQSLWIRKLHAAKGTNLTAVAVANKNVRIAFHILRNADTWFDADRAHNSDLIQ